MNEVSVAGYRAAKDQRRIAATCPSCGSGKHDPWMTCEDLERTVERLLDDEVRRGLPRQTADPEILALIAAILREVQAEEAERERVLRKFECGQALNTGEVRTLQAAVAVIRSAAP